MDNVLIKKKVDKEKIKEYLYLYYYKQLKKRTLSRFERDFTHLKVRDRENTKKTIYDLFKAKIRIL